GELAHAGRSRADPGQVQHGEPLERARSPWKRHFSAPCEVCLPPPGGAPGRPDSPISRRMSTEERVLAAPKSTICCGGAGGRPKDRPRTPAMTFPLMTKPTGLLLALLIAGTATLAGAQERSQDHPRRPAAQQSEQRGPEQRQGESHDSVLRL